MSFVWLRSKQTVGKAVWQRRESNTVCYMNTLPLPALTWARPALCEALAAEKRLRPPTRPVSAPTRPSSRIVCPVSRLPTRRVPPGSRRVVGGASAPAAIWETWSWASMPSYPRGTLHRAAPPLSWPAPWPPGSRPAQGRRIGMRCGHTGEALTLTGIRGTSVYGCALHAGTQGHGPLTEAGGAASPGYSQRGLFPR